MKQQNRTAHTSLDCAFFLEATKALFKDLEDEVSFANIKAFLGEHMPVSAVCLAKYVPEKNALLFLATSDSPPWPKAMEYHRFRPEAEQEARKIRGSFGDIDLINDTEAMPGLFREVLARFMPGPSSLIRMSLVWDTVRLGSLFIHAQGKNRFTDGHVKMVDNLRELFTMAVATMLRHQEILALKARLEEENKTLKSELYDTSATHIIGADFGLKTVMDKVRQVAPRDSTVLLLGETGVGKEVLANAIHQFSGRRERPYIKVNCGAIPETLIDSELFGHEKGAFTGALKQKKGRFERAHKGTIFLDEIGELPLSAQTRLLRILQSSEFERVGATESVTVDVRIIAATNRDLEAMVREGTFREDLFFRLNVFPIKVPPLRERLTDIPELFNHFLEKKTVTLNLSGTYHLAPGAMDSMIGYGWPGNVRELENLVERELIRASATEGEEYLRFDLISGETSRQASFPVAGGMLTLDEAMARHIKQALIMAEGRVEGSGGAAEILGINPATLRSRMRKMGVSFGRKTQNGSKEDG